MKPFFFMICLAVQTSWIAGETATPAPPIAGTTSTPATTHPQSPSPVPNRTSRAWLGLKLSKPDAGTTAHLPGLPPGMGFIVRYIEPGGPAELAGVQANDILWKLGDQWLANESQLAALLRLSSPGDPVTLSGFRAGKPTDFKVTLGQAPALPRGIPAELLDSAVLPGDCGGPWRVINVAEKLASFSSPEGKAEVRKLEEGYSVKITDPNQQVIYDGPLPATGAAPPYSDPWPRRIHALKRGLDHALAGNIPMRQPRPRVVAPPAPKVQPPPNSSPDSNQADTPQNPPSQAAW